MSAAPTRVDVSRGIRRERWGWDIAAAALLVAVVGLVLVLPESFSGSRPLLVLLSAGISLVYALGARRYVGINDGIEDPTPTVSALLQTGLIAMLALAVSIEPVMLVLQTLVLPLIWMTSRSTRQAVLVTLGTGVLLMLAYAFWGGFTRDALLSGALNSGLSAAFSLALGLWITRIAEWGVERQRLLTDLTAAQADLERASRDAGATAERARLARDVHDTIAQNLASIVMLAERARIDGSSPAAIELIEDAARDALVEARALVAVASSAPSSGSLGDALRRLGARFARETGMSVEVAAGDAPIPRDVQVVLLRCAQEGLANVRKHSGASSSRVELIVDDIAELTIRDDGRGLGGVSIDDDRGFGLAGMRERVGLVGGSLTIADSAVTDAGSSTVFGGAALTVRVPLTAAATTRTPVKETP